MRFSRIAILAAGLLSQLAIGATTHFSNERRFMFDVDGNFIDAYGSKINHGKYYLYGNSWSIEGSAAYGIKSYSSVDLVNWNYEGFLYDPTTTDACSGSGGCGRPHIVYNAKTKKYILWANNDGYVVATSDHPATGYKFLSSQPALDPVVAELNPADFAVEIINNEGYIVYSGLNFTITDGGSLWPQISQSLYLGHLTSDLMSLLRTPVDIAAEPWLSSTGPRLFKDHGNAKS
ncbi:Arabinanase/levansucrase/invertase [Penicillium lividum]|nr:Arabinanase/levansucrase/invertase [Penicillium lividum]